MKRDWNYKNYGIQTLRAKENLTSQNWYITFHKFHKITCKVKKACALTNYELGDFNYYSKDAIIQACDELIDGKLHNQFIVDPIQGGAETSTNMNTKWGNSQIEL